MKNNTKMFYRMFTICCYVLLIYVWGFNYIPAILNEHENFRFIFTRTCFFYLQILLTTFGFVVWHLSFSEKVKINTIFCYFGISSILTYFQAFHYLHDLLKLYDLYPSIFKTKSYPDGTKYVASFQYARVLLIIIGCLLFILSLFVKKLKLQKIFFLIFSVSFFGFFFFMHLNIGRAAYIAYENNLRDRYNIVLENNKNYEGICTDLNLLCKRVLLNEEITQINTTKVNKVDSKLDSEREAIKTANKFLKEFIDSREQKKIISESDFITDNLRATTYSFILDGENHVFVIIDTNGLAFALDLYLLIFTGIINVFLVIWIPIYVWLYRKHINLATINKLENSTLKISLKKD